MPGQATFSAQIQHIAENPTTQPTIPTPTIPTFYANSNALS
jgi:hypothetical protein